MENSLLHPPKLPNSMRGVLGFPRKTRLLCTIAILFSITECVLHGEEKLPVCKVRKGRNQTKTKQTKQNKAKQSKKTKINHKKTQKTKQNKNTSLSESMDVFMLGLGVHVCNFSIVETALQVPCKFGLPHEFLASLGNIAKPCLK